MMTVGEMTMPVPTTATTATSDVCGPLPCTLKPCAAVVQPQVSRRREMAAWGNDLLLGGDSSESDGQVEPTPSSKAKSAPQKGNKGNQPNVVACRCDICKCTPEDRAAPRQLQIN